MTKIALKIEELERRIKALESQPRTVYHYHYSPTPYQPYYTQPWTPTTTDGDFLYTLTNTGNINFTNGRL